MIEKPALPQLAGDALWAGPEDDQCLKSSLIHYYRLPAAEKTGRAPMVVMLHGWGGDESSMWIFSRLIPPGAAIFTPRAPIELTTGSGAIWFRHTESRLHPSPAGLQESVTRLGHFIVSLPHLYPVDPARLVLLGFSQGATVGNTLTITQPGVAMALASLAGTVPAGEVIPCRPNTLAGLPVFMAHGEKDTLIPLKAARQARETMNQLGATVTYGEYSVGHKVNNQALDDLQHWLAGVLPAGN